MTSMISWTFLIYFLILFAERSQSMIRIIADGKGFITSGFDFYVNALTLLSLLATAVLLARFNEGFWKSLFKQDVTVNMNILCLTAGVLLLSGMVHTQHTIPVIQFISYGALIIGLILQTVLVVQGGGNAFRHWYSLIFVVTFSMAIPVMYHSSITHAALFHVIEAVAAILLVAMFTYMLLSIMKGRGEDMLLWVPLLTMIVLDGTLIAMRWEESVNSFVLIFAAASAVIFLIGRILFAVIPKK